MSYYKQFKDIVLKKAFGQDFVPEGLNELNEYFRFNENIVFKFHKKDSKLVAVSQNFRHGSIVTQGRNPKELDANIKDAIMTSFEIPSSYADEAKIRNTEKHKKENRYVYA
jgi:hypothetical protein